ncbi:MAG: diguanylate cyclase [Pseudomonadota bacterium]|nr:diguanylate cyclase [Pseudomonadota bacterium]
MKLEAVNGPPGLQGPAKVETPARHRRDLLLSSDPLQRRRLEQAALAMGLLAAGVVGMHYFVWSGVAPAGPVAWWSAGTLAGMVFFFALIRSGVAARFADPSLTVPQMLYALTSSAVAYALLGAGRGAVFPVVMVILMFGMFVATPSQMRWVCVYAVLLFGATMALSATNRPGVYVPRIEFGHFLLVATMMPAACLLSARLSQMRCRSRQQRVELAQALARLRENTTRDELTGIANRRHMQTLIEQEHQRCIRSGQTFCLALLDLDRFKPVNQTHGYAVGDAVLRAVAQEALRHIRTSDTLGRWGGALFVLMMSDTRAPLARGGLERLHGKLSALRILHGSTALGVTLSAGLVEHHAGETVEQTLARAERALQDARAQGRDRVVAAA